MRGENTGQQFEEKEKENENDEIYGQQLEIKSFDFFFSFFFLHFIYQY